MISYTSGRLQASAKSLVRRLSRRAGYELTPVATRFHTAQMILASKADVIVDVGANVGQFAEYMIDSGYSDKIISFEPASDAYRVLARKAREHPNWTVHQVALGATEGAASLHISKNSVSSSLLDIEAAHLRAAPSSVVVRDEQVTVKTLDNVLRGVSGKVYLKLDTQGTELSALKGGSETLTRVVAVQTEVSFDELYRTQSNWLDVARYLESRAFKVRYIKDGYEDISSGFMIQADFLFVAEGIRSLRT